MKHAPLSSTVHGGGKRRTLAARFNSATLAYVPQVKVFEDAPTVAWKERFTAAPANMFGSFNSGFNADDVVKRFAICATVKSLRFTNHQRAPGIAARHTNANRKASSAGQARGPAGSLPSRAALPAAKKNPTPHCTDLIGHIAG